MERTDGHPILALLITDIVMGGTLSVCFWPSQSDAEPYSVDTEAAARSYCSDYLGLTDAEIDGLVARLCS